MTVKVSKLVSVFEKLWPTHLAEEWDVVGLVSGSLDKNVSKVMLTVDVTHDVVEHAIDSESDLILAHHPFMLRGVSSLPENSSKGSLISKLIRADISLYSAHTNADSVASGTSSVLAQAIGISNPKVLSETGGTGLGIGIVGEFPQGLSLSELSSRLLNALPHTASGVRVAGAFDQVVQKVALCAGAGDSYLELALDSGADVYITSDLRHHRAQEILEEAKARGVAFSLIDISHWAAEFLWLARAKTELSAELSDLKFEVCDIRTDVFEFLMNEPKDIQ
jgi:dinuclear metal center YbgI/SA1388 family protein